MCENMNVALPPRIVDLSGFSLNGFASLFSSVFDFSRDKQFFRLLVECARDNLSIEAVCSLRNLSADRLFFYLNGLSVGDVLVYTNMALQNCLQLWKREGKRLSRWGFLIAIDLTSVEYFGRVDEYVHFFVKRDGRVPKKIQVRKYATLSIVAPRFKLCMAIIPVKRDDGLDMLVDRLLESVKTMRVRCVVMDKEFYRQEVLKRIEARGLHYLIPIVRKQSIDQLYWMSKTTGKWKWQYLMGVSSSKRHMVTGYFSEICLGSYTGFITNRDMKTDTAKKLLRLYDQRWNIENGYKEAEHFRVKTSSKNPAYRLLLYTISHLLVNLQNIVRETRYHVRYYEMIEIIRLVLQPTTNGKHHISKRLTIIL
jgi:hypothetical protein